jgi:hypothetical protein
LIFAGGGGLLLLIVGIGSACFYFATRDDPKSAAQRSNPGDSWMPQDKVRAAAARMMSGNNLKQITLAAHSYASNNQDKLPPPAIYGRVGKESKPLLSWRVELLPYIEQENLYRQFHLDEPWDSPHNIQLLDKMPPTYAAPRGFGNAKPHETYYRIFTGPGTLYSSMVFDPVKGIMVMKSPYTIGNVPDGTSNTIFVVEAGDPVPWTKPEELTYDPKGPIPPLAGVYRDLFMVGLLDCSIKSVSRSVKEEHLRAAITAAGGEVLPFDW